MLTNQQAQMFESVARHSPQLRDYLAGELAVQVQTLIKAVDVEQFRRAQGNAQRLQTLIDQLDSALAPRRT